MDGICFFNTAKAWGGGEKWHFEVSRYLHNQGYEVFVIAHTKSVLLEKLLEAKVPCQGIALSNLSFLNPLKHWKIRGILKKGGFRTIVINLSRDVKIAGVCAKRALIKRIVYRRGSAIPIKNTFLNRYYFKNVITEVLANSQATKNTILGHNPNLFPKEKITVIYNGITIPDVLPQFSLAIPQSQKAFTLLTLGRLERQKNHIFLIHLAKAIKMQNLPYKIVIGGAGRLEAELQSLIYQLGVADVVSLRGFIKCPLEFMAEADVFVLPSLWEGFGYVLAEAALCQKPIVAFNLSSNPELVIEGKTGYLVPANNTAAFLARICYLYSHPDKRKEMGEAGAAYVQLHFDRQQQIERIKKYLLR